MKFFICDTESFTDKSNYFKIHHQPAVYLIGLLEFHTKPLKFHHFISINKFWNYIEKIVQVSSITIFFHNAKWDCSFFYQLWLNKYKYVINNKQNLTKNTFTTFIGLNKQVYQIKIKTTSSHSITIKDSVNFIKNSVVELGEDINYPKLDLNYDAIQDFFTSKKDVPKILLKYLIRDCDIVRIYMEKYTPRQLSMLTIGQLSYDAVKFNCSRTQFAKDFECLNKDQWALGKLSYKGGLCQYNHRYKNKIIKNLYCYDINSSYPSIMKTGVVVGTPLTHPPSSGKYTCLLALNLYNVKPKQKSPFYGTILQKNLGIYNIKHHLNYIAKETYIEILLWEHEWYLQKEFYTYDEAIITHKWYFKISPILSTYITKKYYQKKIQKNKSKVLYNKAKLMMNALSGKFGQGKEHTSFAFIDCYHQIENHVQFTTIDKRVVCLSSYKDINQPQHKKPYHRNVFTISYICSEGRCRLLAEILNNPQAIFFYCDTDSLYTNRPLNLKISNELGEWSLDRYSCGVFKGQKSYYVDNTLKLAGYHSKTKPDFYTHVDFINNVVLKHTKLKTYNSGSILHTTKFTRYEK